MFKRLLKGVIMLSISLVFMFAFPGYAKFDEFQEQLTKTLSNFIPEGLASLAVALLFLSILVLFIKGLYFIIHCNFVNPTFEGHVPFGKVVYSQSDFKHIDAVLRFRESRMAGMSAADAEKEYLASAQLDAYYGASTMSKGMYKSIRFLDSKLAGMSAADGYDYIKNHHS